MNDQRHSEGRRTSTTVSAMKKRPEGRKCTSTATTPPHASSLEATAFEPDLK